MEAASELKAKLDQNVIRPEDWTIMPQDVYCNWPTVVNDADSEYDFDYASEYEGYTREQKDDLHFDAEEIKKAKLEKEEKPKNKKRKRNRK